MLDVACERIDALFPDEAAFASAEAMLPAWRRVRCEAFRFAADRRRSVAVWLLLTRLLAARGFDARTWEVAFNAFGKPAFVDRPELAFNLSHAGAYALAVVADRTVGCDVEAIRPVRLEVVRRCFSPSERAFVEAAAEGEARNRAFCRVWVRKESYVKAVGRGLDLAFPSFSCVPGGDSPPGWAFRELACGEGHCAALCVARERRMERGPGFAKPGGAVAGHSLPTVGVEFPA